MPSQAFTHTLEALLVDAAALQEAHTKLMVGKRDRRRELHHLNRASIVFSVSAWEGYVEAIALEAVLSAKPPAPPLGLWVVVEAQARKLIERFHTPNAGNVRKLFAEVLGLPDVSAAWKWQKCRPATAKKYLDDLLNIRHHIAHGVQPRPAVMGDDAAYWRRFVRQLAVKTDIRVAQHLEGEFGVRVGW